MATVRVIGVKIDGRMAKQGAVQVQRALRVVDLLVRIQPGNAALYSASGLSVIRQALSPGGVVAFWSAGPSAAFEGRLRDAGFDLRTERVPVRAGGRGRARHTIWLARPRSPRNPA
mgnify:CR=1 FL=1